MKIKAFILFLSLFCLACERENNLSQSLQKKFKCKNLSQKIFHKKSLKQSEKEKIIQQAKHCLEKGQTEASFFVFESLLKKMQKQGASLKEKKQLEKTLAEIAFYKLENYEKALKYYTLLLKRPQGPGEKFKFQYHIAESFFQLRKYSQARREVEKCFFKGVSPTQKKQALLLKGRVFLAEKKHEEALAFFKEQLEKSPQDANFFREYLAEIYIEKKEISLAIKELEKIQPRTEFIYKKIQRLTERKQQQPGVKR